jgi:sec-independent protein translocase protein TatB
LAKVFGFSFAELTVIMVVALVVVGPERLPKVARTMGHLWGRAQRYVNGVKSDIERDMAIEEYRQLQQKIQSEASALEQSVKQATQTADQQVQKINEAVAQLSSSDQATPGQATHLPSQPAVNPSATPPANKFANKSE